MTPIASQGRRGVIAEALDRATTPAPSDQPIAERLDALPTYLNLPIGEANRYVAGMSQADRDRVLNATKDVIEEEARGPRHGQGRSYVLAQHIAQTPAMSRLVDALDTDDLAARLMAKRGTDADMPPPAMDRRDHLRAALDAHTDPSDLET